MVKAGLNVHERGQAVRSPLIDHGRRWAAALVVTARVNLRRAEPLQLAPLSSHYGAIPAPTPHLKATLG
jgi:hypothetical protein